MLQFKKIDNKKKNKWRLCGQTKSVFLKKLKIVRLNQFVNVSFCQFKCLKKIFNIKILKFIFKIKFKREFIISNLVIKDKIS